MSTKVDNLSDVRSESGIIASLICNSSLMNFSENMSGNDFTDTLNGIIYDAIAEMRESGIEEVDAFNLVSTISRSKSLKKRIGEEPSIEIISEIIENAKYIARKTSPEYIVLVSNVMKLAYRRSLYRDLSIAQDKVLMTDDITTLQREVSQRIERDTEKYITGEEVKSLGEQIDGIWKEIEEKQKTGGGYKVLCVPQLNNYLTIEKQEMVVCMGKMKQGKSMFLMNLALDLIKQGAKILYIDTELSDTLYTRRLISAISGVEADKIKRGAYDKTEKDNVCGAINKIRKLPLYHVYMPNYTNDSVYGIIKTMQKKCGIDTVIFDYIKPPDGSADAFSTYTLLGDLTNMLKNKVAGDMRLHVVSACQASRAGQVADSVRIAQYCSCLIYMEHKTFEEIRTDGADCGNYKFRVMYNRLGGQMDDEEYISANFFGQVCKFMPSKQINPDAIFEQ